MALVQIQPRNCTETGQQPQGLGRLWTVDTLLEESFESLPVLVGDQNNAIIVRGEGHLIVGPPGIGKSLFVIDLSLQLAAGMDILGYSTNSPMNVLLLQTELPIQFVQLRLRRMTESREYHEQSDLRDSIRRIYIQQINDSVDLSRREDLEIIANLVRQVQADVVIFDPFLPFFSGEENSNTEVRRTLDTMKREIAEQCDCAIVITDHIAKSDQGQGARARGASAKIDWASLVINLSPEKSAENERDRIVKAELTKVRYGWSPLEPILLCRDFRTLRHSIRRLAEVDSSADILQIISEHGGEVSSQRRMLQLIRTSLDIGERRARRILTNALRNNQLETESGPNNSIIYRSPSGGEEDSPDMPDDDLAALM
jgi:RecA-family ATPase